MLKTLAILMRGANAQAEEDLADRHALLLLDQHTREAAAGVEASKRSLAVAIAREAAEAQRLASAEAGLADLEARAVAALQAGRDDLAATAAAAIMACEAECNATREALSGFRTEVEAMRRAHADAARRLAATQRGRAVAQAAEAVRRLRATRLRHTAAGASPLADAEAILARLRQRQAEDSAAEAAFTDLDSACCTATVGAAAAKLGEAGFGAPTAPSVATVMARLRAKAAPPPAA